MREREFLDKMLRKGESQLRVGRENPHQQHFRTSWVRFAGVNFHNIPQIEWACPTRFMVDPNWKMEAGSESQETHIQRQRESRIVEAIYLRYSDIPANPFVASDALGFYGDDSRVPIVPLEAINDETLLDDDGGNNPPITLNAKVEETTTQVNNGQPRLQREQVMGMAVALFALIKSKEPGSKIDIELLIELLRNPGRLDHLIMEYGLSSNQEQPSVPMSIPRPSRSELHPVVSGFTKKPWSPSVPFTHSISREVKSVINQIDRSSVKMKTISSPSKYDVGSVRKLINEYGVPLSADSVRHASLSGATTVMKDSDYYRRLVLKHGVNPNPQGSIGVSPIEPYPRPPCVYFNSPSGCKRGTSCWFQHDVKVNMHGVEEHRAKRMKVCGGNFGAHMGWVGNFGMNSN